MRVLLLSAYDAHSHRRWREGLVAAFPEWDWTVLTLPPRNFAWRVRGNSLSWAFAERDTLQQPYDLLIATSMTDLSALKGMVPALAAVPCLLYCHENQFTYPDRRDQQPNDPLFTSLYAALAADRVVFNSGYNRDTFIEGAATLLDKMPDAVPQGIGERIAAKSCVIPVPLEAHWFDPAEKPGSAEQPLTLVWNHRWEYDKVPERLFAALLELQATGVVFRIHIVGQQFREQPPVFAEMQPLLKEYIGEWGMVESRADYQDVLRQSHVVVSTSLHEFQGLAVLEAMACGCLPLVPARMSYPELIAPEFCYPSSPDDPVEESRALARYLAELAARYEDGNLPDSPDVSALSWQALKPAYAAEISALVS